MVVKYGVIMLDIQVITKRVKSMGMVYIIGQINQSMKETGSKIKLKVLVYTLGQMVANMKDIGQKTICMGKVFTHGKMEGNMMVITTWIRSTDLVFTSGLMAESMKECGKTGSSMEKGNTLQQMGSLEEVYGKMERELNGLMKIVNKTFNRLQEAATAIVTTEGFLQ